MHTNTHTVGKRRWHASQQQIFRTQSRRSAYCCVEHFGYADDDSTDLVEPQYIDMLGEEEKKKKKQSRNAQLTSELSAEHHNDDDVDDDDDEDIETEEKRTKRKMKCKANAVVRRTSHCYVFRGKYAKALIFEMETKQE